MKPRIVPSMADARALPIIWTEGIICHAIAQYVEWWRNTVVPNVYLGSSGREIDVAVLTKANLLWAFEIKTSVADWRRDLTKNRFPSQPARFYYVVPETLVQWTEPTPRPAHDAGLAVRKAWWANGRLARPILPEFVPKHAGIVFLRNDRVTKTTANGVEVTDKPVKSYVHPCKSLHRKPLDPKYRQELLAKLGMRYWSHVTGQDMPATVEVA